MEKKKRGKNMDSYYAVVVVIISEYTLKNVSNI
jgi:hypothetical protein